MNISYKHVGPFLFLLFCVTTLLAQGQALSYRVSVLGAGAQDEALPFWLAANRYGLLDGSGPNALTRVAVKRPFVKKKGWDYTVGADLVGRVVEDGTVYPHQLYGGLRYGAFELKAGRWEETTGYLDSTLSAGSMTWSSNATPLPKVILSVPQFTSIPGTAGFMAFKGDLGYGWFEKDRFVESPLLHEKSLFLRFFGPIDFPVHGYAGLSHNVMWAGTHPRLGPLPQDLEALIRVFSAQAGDSLDATVTLGITVTAPVRIVMANS